MKQPVSEPPEDLSPEGKALWHATRRELSQQGLWRDSDAGCLDRYVRAELLAREARSAARDEPFVPGSRGQLVAHPGIRVARDAAADAHRYAEALLLTPRARRDAHVESPEDPLVGVLGG